MVRAATAVCIDRYEASRGDAGAARSISLGIPWTNIRQSAAQTACALAGKRLCTTTEWTAACTGPGALTFPYGNTFIETGCNGSENNVGSAVITGLMSICEGGVSSLYDMSGNVWEWVDPCSSGWCPIRGGSYLNGENSLRCSSSMSNLASYQHASVGFRCCLDN